MLAVFKMFFFFFMFDAVPVLVYLLPHIILVMNIVTYPTWMTAFLFLKIKCRFGNYFFLHLYCGLFLFIFKKNRYIIVY